MRIPLSLIGSDIPLDSQTNANQNSLQDKEEALLTKRAVVQDGGGEKYRARTHAKGKMTAWERIEYICDEDAPILPVGTLVNWGRVFQDGARERLAPGAGLFTVFTKVHDRWVMIIANDNTVASGSWWPKTPEKIQRAQEMALQFRIPVLYLVDCSGLFLPEQSKSFPGLTGAGHIFYKNAELSAEGIPQIAGVFGDCIAGGGYMPIISDKVYMTEQAYMVIAGAALIKGAKSLQLTSLDIGGPEVHVHQSGCADVRVPNDQSCLDQMREDVHTLPSSAVGFYRYGTQPQEPLYSTDGLDGIFPTDHRHAYDIREVVARLVDGSLIHEFLPNTGKEIFTAVARVSGLWIGIAANVQEPQPHPFKPGHRPGGILYREGIAKLSTFSRVCSDDGIPIVWLQDISGFDIGVEAEAQGLLGYGSSLIYSNSTTRAPVMTVLLRKASGAGYYAMHGLPYKPIIQLSTCLTRQSVMEGQTLSIAAFNTKLDDNYEIITEDPVERSKIERGMTKVAARIEKDMDPVLSASQMDTDEVIRLRELRGRMCAFAEMSYQAMGHRRIKNPRIWSIHDVNVLTSGAQVTIDEKPVIVQDMDFELPDGATVLVAPMDGSFWSKPSPDQPPFVSIGQQIQVGQTIGLIEVMKTFTPVRATEAGVLERWVLEEGGACQVGQPVGILRSE